MKVSYSRVVIQGEDRGRMDFRNVGILPQDYTESQSKIPRVVSGSYMTYIKRRQRKLKLKIVRVA